VIVDRALEQRASDGNPIRIGIVGAGFMGRAITRQIVRRVPGIQIVGIFNRNRERALEAWRAAGVEEVRTAGSVAALGDHAAAGRAVVVDDPQVLTDAGIVDVLVETTGAVEFGARVVTRALEQGRHVVLNNAELDGTLGPLLHAMARRNDRILTGIDGDQPAVKMNLVRFVRTIGLRPLVCGNVKGLQDPYRTPLTQAAFAERWGQDAHKVTGFADGTKISYEQAMVANATGFGVAQRGMLGGDFAGHVDELVHHYDLDRLLELGGIVDYVVGARPAPGVYVIAFEEEPSEQQFLRLYKMGDGPLYVFYVPYHLCHYEVPITVARAALFDDAAIAGAAGPVVEVVATAKTDLPAGSTIDGIGGFTTYGQCENAGVTDAEQLLPMGVAEGCRLVRDVPRDASLRYDDVVLPENRLVDHLRQLQHAEFLTATEAH